jgi:hypothetical protein
MRMVGWHASVLVFSNVAAFFKLLSIVLSQLHTSGVKCCPLRRIGPECKMICLPDACDDGKIRTDVYDNKQSKKWRMIKG